MIVRTIQDIPVILYGEERTIPKNTLIHVDMIVENDHYVGHILKPWECGLGPWQVGISLSQSFCERRIHDRV